MPYLLQLRADTSLAAIQAAVGRVRARDVALIFPYGTPVALASDPDFVALHSLQRFCEALDKDVVIIGGDETLRAAAVASGFAAATSLEAWKGASGSRFPRPTPAVADEDDWLVPVALVDADGDQEPDFDVLPEYVQQLLGDDHEYTGPRDQDDVVQARIGRGRDALEEDDGGGVDVVSERYEDGMTATIRGTSGLESWCEAGGSSSEDGEPSDSSTV